MRCPVDYDVAFRFELTEVALLTDTATTNLTEIRIFLAQRQLLISIQRAVLCEIERLAKHNDMKVLVALVNSLERQRRKRRMVFEFHDPLS